MKSQRLILVDGLTEQLRAAKAGKTTAEGQAATTSNQLQITEAALRQAEADLARLAGISETITGLKADIDSAIQSFKQSLAAVSRPQDDGSKAALARIEATLQTLGNKTKPGPLVFEVRRDVAGNITQVVASE